MVVASLTKTIDSLTTLAEVEDFMAQMDGIYPYLSEDDRATIAERLLTKHNDMVREGK